jgi:hypothetical protein
VLNGPWDGLYVEFGVTWRGGYRGYSGSDLVNLPRVTTETGWDSASDIGGERTQGVVLLNTYLSQFKRGWRYTFIYMVRDGEGGNGNQGVFNSDSTPKLSATYIHNLTTVLADDGHLSSTGQLNYSIANQPSTVHDLLLQKSSGVFELAVWNERASGGDDIIVNFGDTFGSVKVYDTTVGIDPVQVLNNVSSVSLGLSDHPVIIELTK